MTNETDTIQIISTLPSELYKKLTELSRFSIKGWCLNSKITLRKKTHKISSESECLMLMLSEGLCVVFPYGVIVLINLSDAQQVMIQDYLAPYITDPIKKTTQLTEMFWLNIQPETEENIHNNNIYIKQLNTKSLELIANVLSKSIMLELYENSVAANFEYVEPIAKKLVENGNLGQNANDLLKHIGASLLAEHNMIGKIALTEKPALLWEHPHLDSLYAKLIHELELDDRKEILDQKIELISRTAQTSLDILQHKHSSRLEWYIIFLIMFEIILDLYVHFVR